ncbi:MAG: 3-methyladenine DNA glycosylase [Methanobacteriaceae archaeon]|jgi:N-glycosylase/DNA lyase|nr:3-methyladenine DNA glycosylase [Methanobacteriaceae archaeon]
MKLKTKINLNLTQFSGQTSQPPWKEINNEFQELVFIDDQVILFKLSQEDYNSLNFNYELPLNCDKSPKKEDIEKKLNEIYDLSFDLENFYNYLKSDVKLAPTIDFCNGLRLFLAKNKFEAIISSISSANNSIARWTNSIDKIKNLWGLEYEFPSGKFYSFPYIETLKNSYEEIDPLNCDRTLKNCGVGYRSKFIKQSSEFCLNENIEDISKMSYDEAFEFILDIPGVGPKVADCILLYGFDFKEAFPTDIWIKRIISYLYFNNKDISVKKVREFGLENFKENAGYIQLYLFHYARKSGLMKKLKL